MLRTSPQWSFCWYLIFERGRCGTCLSKASQSKVSGLSWTLPQPLVKSTPRTSGALLVSNKLFKLLFISQKPLPQIRSNFFISGLKSFPRCWLFKIRWGNLVLKCRSQVNYSFLNSSLEMDVKNAPNLGSNKLLCAQRPGAHEVGGGEANAKE